MGESGFCPSTGIYHNQWRNTTFFTGDEQHPSLPQHLLHPTTTLSPSKPAFIDANSGTTVTFQDLHILTSSIAKSLLDSGITKGDVVLFVSPNFLQFPAFVLGIMSTGAILSTANFLHTRQELEAQVHDSKPVLVITTQDLQSKLESLIIIRPLLLVETILARVEGTSISHDLPVVDISRLDIAALMYSSGTTGRSKAVMCTHGNMIAMSRTLQHAWTHSVGGGQEEVDICVVPLFHMFGLSVFICGAIATGSTVVVMTGRYVMDRMLQAVEKYRATRVMVVPPMVVEMVRSASCRRSYDLGSLREVVCSGAPLAMEHTNKFASCFPKIRLSQCYGLTEAVGPVILCDGVKGRIHASVGRLAPSLSAKIMDVHTREPLPPDSLGELYVKGPSIMQGYLNDQEATTLTINEEGWLHTGDLCFIDKRGLVYVVGRIKELIKYKAYQVAPAELEEILSTHPNVTDVAVLPYPDVEAGEIPMACVVGRAGSKVKENDIISFVENKVAPYKRIRKVMFVDFIPRSATGKILRRLLKEKNTHYTDLEITSRL